MDLVYVKSLKRWLEIPECWTCFDRGTVQRERHTDTVPCSCPAGERWRIWAREGAKGKFSVETFELSEESEDGKAALAIYEARFGPLSEYRARQERRAQEARDKWGRFKRRLRSMD